eukprot:TRINITY_DN4020_c0_g1_i1.p1 TRINITY_DN4020_c0_g1~~TRINITY_DN4020_c0_g1_i1.p1  ORF type:complete len:246 (-),score=18.68 TRINITY_DN4020_c0_g1_i1:114-851(-)
MIMSTQLFAKENRDVLYQIIQYVHGSDLIALGAVSKACAQICCNDHYKKRLLELRSITDLNFDDRPLFYKKEYVRTCRSISSRCALCDVTLTPLWFVDSTGRFHDLKICRLCSQTKVASPPLLHWHHFRRSVLESVAKGTVDGKEQIIISDMIALNGLKNFRITTLIAMMVFVLAVMGFMFIPVFIVLCFITSIGATTIVMFIPIAVVSMLMAVLSYRDIWRWKTIRRRIKSGTVTAPCRRIPSL